MDFLLLCNMYTYIQCVKILRSHNLHMYSTCICNSKSYMYVYNVYIIVLVMRISITCTWENCFC